jgi:hypothetical protein
VTQLGVVLSDFSDAVVSYVTSPRTGIQRRSKWPPTISEVVSACEEYQDYLARTTKPVRRFESLPRPEPYDGQFAQIFVPTDHTRYVGLVEWAKTAHRKFWCFGQSSDGRDGIWVAYGAWDNNTDFLRGSRA